MAHVLIVSPIFKVGLRPLGTKTKAVVPNPRVADRYWFIRNYTMFFSEKLPDSLCYICLWLTIDAHLL